MMMNQSKQEKSCNIEIPITNNNNNNNRIDENSRQDNNCCICFGNIINMAIINDCQHSFCWDCINEWIRMNHKKCPLCRRWIQFIQYNIRSTNDYDLKQVVHELQDHLLFFRNHQNHH